MQTKFSGKHLQFFFACFSVKPFQWRAQKCCKLLADYFYIDFQDFVDVEAKTFPTVHVYIFSNADDKEADVRQVS